MRFGSGVGCCCGASGNRLAAGVVRCTAAAAGTREPGSPKKARSSSRPRPFLPSPGEATVQPC
ncbi:MAG: hypothetical protein F6K62_10135 [Sphaerospermopsis sp. SIO1G2]|nr:hypothetical protein [Sphaerospermopsis sp. SIO1G2]